MESLEHNWGNISPTICTNMLIFGKDTFLVLISLMISTNLISSQILIFVTSHFTTLYRQKQAIKEFDFWQHLGANVIKNELNMQFQEYLTRVGSH